MDRVEWQEVVEVKGQVRWHWIEIILVDSIIC